MSKVLDDLKCHPMWVSHIGCLKGCLDYLEMDVSTSWLFGITGHAFINNIGRGVCPSGPTAWKCDMLFKLGRNAGFEVETIFGVKSDADFAQKQAEAWGRVRVAIDEGFPCYGWELDKPEYYVINGYNDSGYIYNGHGTEGSVKTWHELGDSDIRILVAHVVKPGRPTDEVKAVKSALDFAVQFGLTQNWLFPNYASGSQGFELWIQGLESGQAEGFGVAYNAVVWAECRKHAVGFLNEIVALGILSIAEVDAALQAYQVSAQALEEVSEMFPFFGHKPEHIVDAWRREKAVDLLSQVCDAEADGLDALAQMVELLDAEVKVV